MRVSLCAFFKIWMLLHAGMSLAEHAPHKKEVLESRVERLSPDVKSYCQAIFGGVDLFKKGEIDRAASRIKEADQSYRETLDSSYFGPPKDASEYEKKFFKYCLALKFYYLGGVIFFQAGEPASMTGLKRSLNMLRTSRHFAVLQNVDSRIQEIEGLIAEREKAEDQAELLMKQMDIANHFTQSTEQKELEKAFSGDSAFNFVSNIAPIDVSASLEMSAEQKEFYEEAEQKFHQVEALNEDIQEHRKQEAALEEALVQAEEEQLRLSEYDEKTVASDQKILEELKAAQEELLHRPHVESENEKSLAPQIENHSEGLKFREKTTTDVAPPPPGASRRKGRTLVLSEAAAKKFPLWAQTRYDRYEEGEWGQSEHNKVHLRAQDFSDYDPSVHITASLKDGVSQGFLRLPCPEVGSFVHPNSIRLQNSEISKVELFYDKLGGSYLRVRELPEGWQDKAYFKYSCAQLASSEFLAVDDRKRNKFVNLPFELEEALNQWVPPSSQLTTKEKAEQIQAMILSKALYNTDDQVVQDYLDSKGEGTKLEKLSHLYFQSSELPKHLRGKGVDCDVWSELYLNLAKKAGLKARMVGGYKNVDGNNILSSSEGHGWVEVYDPDSQQWMVLDPTPSRRGLSQTQNLQVAKAELKKKIGEIDRERIMAGLKSSEAPTPQVLAHLNRENSLEKIVEYNKQLQKAAQEIDEKIGSAELGPDTQLKLIQAKRDFSQGQLKSLKSAHQKIHTLSEDPHLRKVQLESLAGQLQSLGEHFPEDYSGQLDSFMREVAEDLHNLRDTKALIHTDFSSEHHTGKIIDGKIYIQAKNSFQSVLYPLSLKELHMTDFCSLMLESLGSEDFLLNVVKSDPYVDDKDCPSGGLYDSKGNLLSSGLAGVHSFVSPEKDIHIVHNNRFYKNFERVVLEGEDEMRKNRGWLNTYAAGGTSTLPYLSMSYENEEGKRQYFLYKEGKRVAGPALEVVFMEGAQKEVLPVLITEQEGWWEFYDQKGNLLLKKRVPNVTNGGARNMSPSTFIDVIDRKGEKLLQWAGEGAYVYKEGTLVQVPQEAVEMSAYDRSAGVQYGVTRQLSESKASSSFPELSKWTPKKAADGSIIEGQYDVETVPLSNLKGSFGEILPMLQNSLQSVRVEKEKSTGSVQAQADEEGDYLGVQSTRRSKAMGGNIFGSYELLIPPSALREGPQKYSTKEGVVALPAYIEPPLTDEDGITRAIGVDKHLDVYGVTGQQARKLGSFRDPVDYRSKREEGNHLVEKLPKHSFMKEGDPYIYLTLDGVLLPKKWGYQLEKRPELSGDFHELRYTLDSSGEGFLRNARELVAANREPSPVQLDYLVRHFDRFSKQDSRGAMAFDEKTRDLMAKNIVPIVLSEASVEQKAPLIMELAAQDQYANTPEELEFLANSIIKDPELLSIVKEKFKRFPFQNRARFNKQEENLVNLFSKIDELLGITYKL